MQLTIDGRLILPHMTGVGRYLVGLCRALSQEADPGFKFELLLQDGLQRDHPAWQLNSPHFRVRGLALSHMQVRQQWAIPYHLLRHPANLFHYPHFDLPFATPGRVVATLHDLKYIARPDFFPRVGGAKRLVMWMMMLFTVRRAGRVIVDSDNTRQDILHYLKANPERLMVIPLGIDEVYFSPVGPAQSDVIRHRYQLFDPYILFVGERRPHKNIPGLLQAFALFRRQQNRKHHLVLCGNSYADYQEPRRLAEELGLKDCVHFVYVNDEDLPGIYQAAEAFAMLSYYEGFGLPILEAMASGTPVVAANTTSLPEVCGNAGLMVPPDDVEQAAAALSKVVIGGAERETAIQNGLAWASAFTWEKCAQKTLGVYQEAVRL